MLVDLYQHIEQDDKINDLLKDKIDTYDFMKFKVDNALEESNMTGIDPEQYLQGEIVHGGGQLNKDNACPFYQKDILKSSINQIKSIFSS